VIIRLPNPMPDTNEVRLWACTLATSCSQNVCTKQSMLLRPSHGRAPSGAILTLTQTAALTAALNPNHSPSPPRYTLKVGGMMLDAAPYPTGVALINEGCGDEVNVDIYPVDLAKARSNGIVSFAVFTLNRDVADGDELLTDYGALYEPVRRHKGYTASGANSHLPGRKRPFLSHAEEQRLPHKLVAVYGHEALQQLMPFSAVHDDYKNLQVRGYGSASRYGRDNDTTLCGVEYGVAAGARTGVGQPLVGLPLAGRLPERHPEVGRPPAVSPVRGTPRTPAVSLPVQQPVQLGSEGRPADGDVHRFHDTTSDAVILLTRAVAGSLDATDDMRLYNRTVADAIAPGKPIHTLIECSAANEAGAAASKHVSALLATDRCSDRVGGTALSWKRRSVNGLLLCIGETRIEGYGSYNLSDAKRHNARTQRGNNIMIGKDELRAMTLVRDQLLQQAGHGCAERLVTQPPEGQGLLPSFICSLVFLVEVATVGAAAGFLNCHLVNSASEHTRFRWHTDDHDGIDDHTDIKQSTIFQCGAGSSPIHIAGAGKYAYPAVGAHIRFPAALLHRTGQTVLAGGCSQLWKLAVFNEGPYLPPLPTDHDDLATTTTTLATATLALGNRVREPTKSRGSRKGRA